MKKSILVVLITLLFVFGASAARTNFYLDAGVGFGRAKTTMNGYDYADGFLIPVTDLGIEFGAKAGLNPVKNLPLFVVLDLDWGANRFSFKDSGNKYSIQFSSVLLGPGIVFYPNSLFQLAASAGLSLAEYSESWSYNYIDYKTGFAWSVSAALDFGNKRNGFLLGVKYLIGTNTIVYWDDEASSYGSIEQKNSVFSIFARFAVRKISLR